MNNLLKGRENLAARLLTGFAWLLIFRATFGPLVQFRAYDRIVNEESFWASSSVYQWGAIALIVLGLASVVFSMLSRYEFLSAFALVTAAISLILVSYQCYQFIGWGTITPRLFLPVFIFPGNHTRLGWPWYAMLFASLIIGLAGHVGYQSTDPSFAKGAAGLLVTKLKHSTRAPKKKQQVAVMGHDVTGLLLNGLLGLLIFGFCAGVPFLGYFVWRHLDNENSKYVSVSLFGWIFGTIVIVGGFLLRLLLVMWRVGTS